MFCIKVIDKNEFAVAVARDENEVNLALTREYQEGDRILIEVSDAPVYAWLQLDDALGRSLVYLTEDYSYQLPFGEKRINLSPKVFSGKTHLLSIRRAKDFEISAYRNLAYNVNDCHVNSACFPHASANIETRGESVFAARNAIDGIVASNGHGEWPWSSWGINRDPEAELTLDFGRNVEIDRIIVYTRADFPHDAWWDEGTFSFSDGSELVVKLEKKDGPQEFTFEKKTVSLLSLSRLIKSSDPSPFPALIQLEVYGNDC